MKKLMLSLSASVLLLSMAGAASAAPVDQTPPTSIQTATVDGSNATIYIKFVPADGDTVTIMDQSITLQGLGSSFVMTSGSNWAIERGSNVVSLSGATVTAIGYGKAEINAYKGNRQFLGVYYVEVVR